ncbi:MAG: GDP-mannose 4,6-dehydratase [Betaproteobacteria bacterium]
MPTTLVTGINGFTGRYLAERLRTLGHTVVGLGIDADVPPEMSMSRCDLTDREGMLALVPRISPDYVVHLGGIAFVAHGDVDAIYRTNIVGTHNLLEALALCNTPPKMVLLASTAHIYGNAATCPIDETAILAPESDYAVSKLAMENMARLWTEQLRINIVRPFNYTGVGQSLNFLLPKIVDHFQRKESRIELGNLDVIRDFSDVRDIVDRYCRLLESAARGELFNTCSGIGHSLQEVLTMMRELSGHNMDVVVNAAFVRDNEVHKLIGSSAKLETVIGKHMATPLRQTLAWMLQSK